MAIVYYFLNFSVIVDLNNYEIYILTENKHTYTLCFIIDAQ